MNVSAHPEAGRPAPKQRSRCGMALAWTLTALALSVGVSALKATSAEAAARGPDGTVYQLQATCDWTRDQIILQLNPFWKGNVPIVYFDVWSQAGRYEGGGWLRTDGTSLLAFPWGTSGKYYIKATYYWFVNGQVRTASEWLPSYTNYNMLSQSLYCQL